MDIAFQGYYIVPQADATSFKSLSFGAIALGKDAKAVYCGSRTIPELDPRRIAFVSSGYISDGNSAWYCSDEKPNPGYHWWQIFTRSSADDNPSKPRRKDYQLTRLDGTDAGKLKTVADGYAYDSKTILYDGQSIAGSDAASVQTVKRGFGELKGSDSDHYLRDRNRVYYKGIPLGGAHPEHFTALTPDADQWQTEYGFDASTGKYYFGAQTFPDTVDGKDARSLKLLLADRDRANHELFYNSSGIWYWDYQESRLERACANPFHLDHMSNGKPSELTPGVWADGDNTFIVRAAQDWRTGKYINHWGLSGTNGDVSLRANITELGMMSGISSSEWEEIEVIKRGWATQGTLWRVRNTYYYTPSSVTSVGFTDSLYQVTDVRKLKDYIAQRKDQSNLQSVGRQIVLVPVLIQDNVLAPVPSTQIVCRASSHYPSAGEFWKN
jgi:hypothetical protein